VIQLPLEQIYSCDITAYSEPGDWVFASFRLKGKQPRVGNMLVEDYLRPAAAKATRRIKADWGRTKEKWIGANPLIIMRLQ
jgi:hypothetical protein